VQSQLNIREEKKTVYINEIFTSLQGEGKFMGLPTVFVRLQGCRACCDYCDTEYAQNMEEGKEVSITHVISKIANESNAKRVCITGGEPLLQKEAVKEIINRSPLPVSVETNGLHRFDDLDCPCTVDIKMPSSGVDLDMKWIYKARPIDEFKIVVKDKKDFMRATAVIQSLRDSNKDNPVWISPCFGEIGNEKLAKWILDNPFLRGDVRMQIQMHKVIWDPKERGV